MTVAGGSPLRGGSWARGAQDPPRPPRHPLPEPVWGVRSERPADDPPQTALGWIRVGFGGWTLPERSRVRCARSQTGLGRLRSRSGRTSTPPCCNGSLVRRRELDILSHSPATVGNERVSADLAIPLSHLLAQPHPLCEPAAVASTRHPPPRPHRSEAQPLRRCRANPSRCAGAERTPAAAPVQSEPQPLRRCRANPSRHARAERSPAATPVQSEPQPPPRRAERTPQAATSPYRRWVAVGGGMRGWLGAAGGQGCLEYGEVFGG